MVLEKFLKDISNEKKNFLKAPIYLYGTEAIGSYYNLLDLKNKTFLTVNGSGDQILNAYYFGAKKVVGFDIVQNTKYMLDLKKAFIKNLSRLEFLNFFGNKKDLGDFDYKIYNSLKPGLEKDTNLFFEKLFKKFDYDGAKLLRSGNFRTRKEFYNKLFVINPFLANDKNYSKMKKRLANVDLNFVEADICDVYNKINEKFDLINLSNVLNYISKDLVKKNVDKPLEEIYEVLLRLKSLLKKEGKIVYYAFYRRPGEDTMPLINQKSSLKWIKEKKDFEVSVKKFDGILWGKDWITELKKKG